MVKSDTLLFTPAVVSGFQVLLEARQYAKQLNRNPWDFAVPVDEMTALGCTVNVMRWLVLSGYAEVAIEISGTRKRAVKRPMSWIHNKRASFILTESGVQAAKDFGMSENGHPRKRRKNVGAVIRPRFVNRELCVGNQVIKRFRQPAESQELILLAFEEQGWEKEIDDPLPPVHDVDSKLRLRHTIDNLNRHQLVALIHFYGDGTGQRIGWEWRS